MVCAQKEMTPAQQAHVFAAMLLTGAGMGAAHDLLAPLRRGALCWAADLLLGALGAAGMIAAALWLRCEAFRLYTFAAAACGAALYALTVGRIVRICARACQKRWKKETA